MTEYKLFYFNLKGRGEVIRLIFLCAGQKYDDVRISREEWPSYKAKSPTGQAPFLEIKNGSRSTLISQSMSIARYLGRKFNMAGRDEIEQAEVDMYGDQVTDLMNEMIKARFDADEIRKAQQAQKLEAEIIPNSMRIFDSRLAKSSSGYLASSGITWADLHLFTVLEWMPNRDKVLNNYKNVKALDQKIRSMPKIAHWLATRPHTDF